MAAADRQPVQRISRDRYYIGQRRGVIQHCSLWGPHVSAHFCLSIYLGQKHYSRTVLLAQPLSGEVHVLGVLLIWCYY
jgi:hypothetical protein